MTDELRSPAPLDRHNAQYGDATERYTALAEKALRHHADIDDEIGTALMLIDVRNVIAEAVAAALSDQDATLREERDTAVAHANGLTDLIRRMDNDAPGYVRGLEDAAQAISFALHHDQAYMGDMAAKACITAIRALAAQSAAQINAAPQVGRTDIPEREPNTEPPAVAAPSASCVVVQMGHIYTKYFDRLNDAYSINDALAKYKTKRILERSPLHKEQK